MKNGVLKKMLVLTLCVAVVAGSVTWMMPTMAAAATTAKTIEFDLSHVAKNLNTNNAATVAYGDKTWRVIGYNGNGVASASNVMTLLASDTFSSCQFDNGDAKSNAYATSILKEKVDGIADAFNEREKTAIIPRDLEGGGTYSATSPYCNGIAGDAVQNALLWPLSAQEADAVHEKIRWLSNGNQAHKCWWLRSPGETNDYAAWVHANGNFYPDGRQVDFGSWSGIRPAFNLDVTDILFASAKGAKSSQGLSVVNDYTGKEWKLTLRDTQRTLSVTESALKAYAGDTVSINYSGAQTGDDEYISAMIADASGEIVYYGPIAKASASGTASITLPSDIAIGTYTLKVFNEQRNGDNRADVASPFVNVTLAVLNQYTLSYDANGGEGAPASTQHCEGDNVTVDFATLPTYEGYVLLGWDESKTATAPTYTATGPKTFNISADTTLYAVWGEVEELKVTIVGTLKHEYDPASTDVKIVIENPNNGPITLDKLDLHTVQGGVSVDKDFERVVEAGNTNLYQIEGLETLHVGTHTMDVTVAYHGMKTTLSADYVVTPKSIAGSTITVKGTYEYTGQEIKPSITVNGDGGETLVEGVDYTVAYDNNINAGTGSITITGIGNYTGQETATFTIEKAEHPQVGVLLKETLRAVKGGEYSHALPALLDGMDVKKVTFPSATSIVESGEHANRVLTVKVSDTADVGGAEITVVLESQNYQDVTYKLTVQKVSKTVIQPTLDDIHVSCADGRFTAQPKLPEGSQGGKWTWTVQNSALLTAEENNVFTILAGGSTVITGKYESDTEIGEVSALVTIDKVKVTVTIGDLTARVKESTPLAGSVSYSVTGLIGTDTITLDPVNFEFSSTPDMSKPGTYEIRYVGAVLLADMEKKYEATVIPGKLIVYEHRWAGAWSSNATHHWHQCLEKDCIITDIRDMLDYGEHVDKGGDGLCDVCGYRMTTATLPQTGDNEPLALWMALCVLSAAGALMVAKRGRKMQ